MLGCVFFIINTLLSCGKGKYLSIDNPKMGIKVDNFLPKKWRGFQMKDTNKIPHRNIDTF